VLGICQAGNSSVVGCLGACSQAGDSPVVGVLGICQSVNSFVVGGLGLRLCVNCFVVGCLGACCSQACRACRACRSCSNGVRTASGLDKPMPGLCVGKWYHRPRRALEAASSRDTTTGHLPERQQLCRWWSRPLPRRQQLCVVDGLGICQVGNSSVVGVLASTGAPTSLSSFLPRHQQLCRRLPWLL
jgi:hypothetical protein